MPKQIDYPEQIDYLEDAKNLLDEANGNLVESDYWHDEKDPIREKKYSDLAEGKYSRVSMLALVAIADELRKLNINIGALGPQQ